MIEGPTPAPPASAAHATLWLTALEGVGEGAAHELKNALNGVSVNLSVVESRLRRQGAPEAITRFAEAAASQLELLTAQVEALLTLVRPPRGALEVGALARQLVVLSGRSDRGESPFLLRVPAAGAAETAVDAAVARTLVAAVLGPALAHPGPGECAVEPLEGGAVRVTVRGAGVGGGALAALAAAYGATVAQPAADVVAVTLPPARDPAKL